MCTGAPDNRRVVPWKAGFRGAPVEGHAAYSTHIVPCGMGVYGDGRLQGHRMPPQSITLRAPTVHPMLSCTCIPRPARHSVPMFNLHIECHASKQPMIGLGP